MASPRAPPSTQPAAKKQRRAYNNFDNEFHAHNLIKIAEGLPYVFQYGIAAADGEPLAAKHGKERFREVNAGPWASPGKGEHVDIDDQEFLDRRGKSVQRFLRDSADSIKLFGEDLQKAIDLGNQECQDEIREHIVALRNARLECMKTICANRNLQSFDVFANIPGEWEDFRFEMHRLFSQRPPLSPISPTHPAYD